MMGNDVVKINMGVHRATLALNVYRPMVYHNFLQTVRLLADMATSISTVRRGEPNRERITRLLNESR
ncbi:hypothetical protein KCP69_15305 [Salmonella enterica subsp. enterica]|nr:hypothetical protein KCP69_15305 [Salmonella enterica subsp. enterica]